MKKKNIFTQICLILSLCFCFIINNAIALDNSTEEKDSYYFPYLTGNILTEYNFSRMDSRSDGNRFYKDKRNLSYLQIESNLNLYISNNFLIKTNTVFRPVLNRMEDKTRYYDDYYTFEKYFRRKAYFDRYDIIFEELAFEYKEEEFLFGLGKFNPTFGTAYDKSKYHPIFGTKIAEDYELTEKLGFYVGITLPMFNLRGNFFYNDDTFLSRSLFGNRSDYDAEKGVGNEKSLKNYSITADFGIQDYRFNLGVRRLGAENSFERAEKGYVIGVEKLIEETPNAFGFLPFAEYSFIENYNGTKNRDINFFTVRLPLVYRNWNFIAAYSLKYDDEDHFKDYKSYLAELGVGYKFRNGIMVDVAKINERETYKVSATEKASFKTDSFGIRISYMYLFEEN